MIDKNWQGVVPDPEWVAQEIDRLNAAVDDFAFAMKAKLAEKVQEGWTGWDQPASSIKIWKPKKMAFLNPAFKSTTINGKIIPQSIK